MVCFKLTSEASIRAWSAVHSCPVPEKAIHASLGVDGFGGDVEQSHVETANVVLIIGDVVLWAPGPTLTLVHFVCPWRTHVTINIQLIHAHSAPLIARMTILLIICNSSICTFASQDVGRLSISVCGSNNRCILNKQCCLITQETVISAVCISTIPTRVMTLIASERSPCDKVAKIWAYRIAIISSWLINNS